jgi:succinate dehydrogenase / fumarate reductase membrane anchor subunit
MSYHVDGLRVWLLQRVSAMYLALYLVGVAGYFWLHPAPDYASWRAWFADPLVAITSAGFVLAVLIHGWVGLRDVILDYIHPLGLRLALLTLFAFLLIGCGIWGVRILILASGMT